MHVSAMAAIASVAWGPVSGTQTADASRDTGLTRTQDEIVVTARRNPEDAQAVPIAMGVVGAAEIDSAQITNLERLQRLEPSLHVFGFNPRLTSITIRALGGNVGLTSDGLEGGVGVFADDVYVGRVGSTMFSLLDVERIEVLRGPQGTLFGRNTTAGVIHVVSRAPSLDSTERIVEVSAGDHGFSELKGLVSGRLRGDTIAGRIALLRARRDGFVTNVHTGESVQNRDDAAFRGQLLFVPRVDPVAPRLTGRVRVVAAIKVPADPAT